MEEYEQSIPFARQTAGETMAHFLKRRDRDLAEVKKNVQHFGFTTVFEYIKYLQSEVEKVNTRIANTPSVFKTAHPKTWRNTKEESRSLRANDAFALLHHPPPHQPLYSPHPHWGGGYRRSRKNKRRKTKRKTKRRRKKI